MPGESQGLLRDPLHQAAVADQGIGVMIDQILSEHRFEMPLRDRHADGIAEALAERPGGGLDPALWPYSGCPAVRDPSWRKFLISSSVMSA